MRVLESISFLNLILLSGIILYAGGKSTVYLDVSIGVSFVQFCVIVLLSVIKICFKSTGRCLKRSGSDEESDINYERTEDPDNDTEMKHALGNTISTY